RACGAYADAPELRLGGRAPPGGWRPGEAAAVAGGRPSRRALADAGGPRRGAPQAEAGAGAAHLRRGPAAVSGSPGAGAGPAGARPGAGHRRRERAHVLRRRSRKCRVKSSAGRPRRDCRSRLPSAHRCRTPGFPPERALVDGRVVYICVLSILIAGAAGFVAQVLTRLIGLVTNLSLYGSVSTVFTSPAANRLGPLVILVPIAGAVVVGLMARYGSAAIRGHGIPEAMEQVLLNKSRIPARITLLKPVSAAISIGTGGPFGAEGPIIATGGAVGPLLGQLLHTTAAERKTRSE